MTKSFRWFFAFLGILIFALPNPAFAARQCYMPAELEAEQLLRLHSQMMFITYQCKQGSKAQNLVSYYEAFTSKNMPALKKAEQTLTDYFRKRYNDDGIAHLDDLHTKLGNEFGQEAAEELAPLYCRQYRDWVIGYFYETPMQLSNAVRRMALNNRSYTALCKMADNSKTASAK